MSASSAPLIIALRAMPDVAAGKRVHGLQALADAEALQALTTLRRIAGSGDALPLAMHSLVAIATAQDAGGQWSLAALASAQATEVELLQALAAQLQDAPTAPLLFANAAAPALLRARALCLGIAMPRLFAAPISVLADAVPSCTGTLRELAALCGLPRIAEWNVEVVPALSSAEILAARAAVEIDALLLERLGRRLQFVAGQNDASSQAAATARAADWLSAQDAPHWLPFRCQGQSL